PTRSRWGARPGRVAGADQLCRGRQLRRRPLPIPAPPRAYIYPRLSPDGTRVALDVRDQDSDVWIWDFTRTTLTRLTFDPRPDRMVMALDAPRRVEPLVHSAFAKRNAALSPDGRWLAYDSDESGRYEVYVHPFPDVKAGRWQVSTAGGPRAAWARNGQ